MTFDDLSVYGCPGCGHEALAVDPAAPVERNASGLERANLRCAACGSVYPVRNAIPRFVPQENYAQSFGYQWNAHRKTQLDSHTGLTISRDRLFQVSGWPESMPGQLVLEAGSGAGRFTEALLDTQASVYSFDLSSAVEANRENNGHRPNLHLFQASLDRLPFRKGSFDKVCCLGVLQHTPDPAESFRCLAGYVRPGGEIVVDVYAKDLLALLHWKYLLRPLTSRMDSVRLYRIVQRLVPPLIPLSRTLRRWAGRAGHRLIPIIEYSHLGLSEALNEQWAILDTFDMYAPAHDHPQTLPEVERWFAQGGFRDVVVKRGPNGVIGKGRRSAVPAA